MPLAVWLVGIGLTLLVVVLVIRQAHHGGLSWIELTVANPDRYRLAMDVTHWLDWGKHRDQPFASMDLLIGGTKLVREIESRRPGSWTIGPRQ